MVLQEQQELQVDVILMHQLHQEMEPMVKQVVQVVIGDLMVQVQQHLQLRH